MSQFSICFQRGHDVPPSPLLNAFFCAHPQYLIIHPVEFVEENEFCATPEGFQPEGCLC